MEGGPVSESEAEEDEGEDEEAAIAAAVKAALQDGAQLEMEVPPAAGVASCPCLRPIQLCYCIVMHSLASEIRPFHF